MTVLGTQAETILKHVAHIIRSVVSHDEVGVRLGGDEFAVLVKQGAERLHNRSYKEVCLPSTGGREGENLIASQSAWRLNS
jgi:GGDEF domain-containing protein